MILDANFIQNYLIEMIGPAIAGAFGLGIMVWLVAYAIGASIRWIARHT